MGVNRLRGKVLSGPKKKQIEILRHALFGKSAGVRMQALLLLTQCEIIDGGWLLEAALKYENLSVNSENFFD